VSKPIIRVSLSDGDVATARSIQAVINGEHDAVDFPGVSDGGGEVTVRFGVPEDPDAADGPGTMGISLFKTWQVRPEAVRELAADLISTAVEGGINYWASCEGYKWGGPLLGHSDDRPWTDEDVTYAQVTIHETESSDDGPPKIVFVNVAKMWAAIRQVVAGDVKPFYNASSYSETFRERLLALLDQLDEGKAFDECEFLYDADDADSMMQIAVLGEIIYG